MSVLIARITMPKNCAECPFLYDNDACYAMNNPRSYFLPLVINGSSSEYKLNEFPFREKRVDWCPLEDVRGKWIYDKYAFAHCSECGYEHDEPEYVTPFCPNCGADMRGEAND